MKNKKNKKHWILTIYGIAKYMLEPLCGWLFSVTKNVSMLENNSRSINCLYIWDSMFSWYFRTRTQTLILFCHRQMLDSGLRKRRMWGGGGSSGAEEGGEGNKEGRMGSADTSPCRCPLAVLLFTFSTCKLSASPLPLISPESCSNLSVCLSACLSIYLSMHVSTFSVLSVRPSVPFCSRFVRCLYGK